MNEHNIQYAIDPTLERPKRFNRDWHNDRHHDANVSEMLGKAIEKIDLINNEQISFYLTDGARFVLHHVQAYSEHVWIDDIAGDFMDLIGEPLTMAEGVAGAIDVPWGIEEWVFYKFATIKGYVTIQWRGESNGYYSVEVDVTRVDPEKEGAA